MPGESTTAIVLRAIEFSETSYVVTLFSRDFGKVQALAKGARRPKGPFESALDLLSLCRVVLLRKSSDALDLLTEAKLERRFRVRGRDLSSLYAGYYVAELLRELTGEGDPHPLLFEAADRTLSDLGQSDPVASLVLRFEIDALRILGHLPTLETCVECGRRVPLSGRLNFGILSGGSLCDNCRPGKRQVVSIGAGTAKTLLNFADPNSDAWKRHDLKRSSGELRGVVNQYLWSLIGRKPRLLPYLRLLSS